ncbi:hypothetical protein Slin15195_G009510 [Septoria linicola]|uniref:Zn(2)-C6 fungal-type domain-containing protein n=1 Tax=Septoria linicola TaxID=215465 RepID=A0A9Q9AEP6_9PEZI|nr:hypothetical protein Slin14017_G009520 [Septoria linicola]USW47632.1 hypothetical protein Slin15195_G009510 [Septoria linicola]
MAEPRNGVTDDGFFNDLSRHPSHNTSLEDAKERRESHDGQADSGQVPKPKRIACVLCRKRKLKCDGTKPSCGTCSRLQHDCSYDEVRKKSGPKRGYVKALEARLAQVETLLKTQDDQPVVQRLGDAGRDSTRTDYSHNATTISNSNVQKPTASSDFLSHAYNGLDPAAANPSHIATEEPFPWEMIGLGLDEPLPTQDVIDELNQAYFDKVHPSLPMIHRPRYRAAMHLAPHMRPPVCLRYAMWANAAAVTNKFEALQDHFYQRARKYIQSDEMKGHGESMITIAHCQTWILLATHEFKLMYFPRAWMSAGRACRMALMMGLHRMDGIGLDVRQCLAPPKDWTEREERRRTFWMSFCVDRYSSIGTGWPMTIEESDILTSLPAEEELYEMSRPAKTITLFEALEPSGTSRMSPLAGVIVLACLFGRNLTHLHRPDADDQDDDLNGNFWKRHRSMDNILLNTALALPDSLRLPSGLNNPNVIFMNMNIHTSTICLHQAAIFKADKNRMPARISAESKVRCITAAAEIASIMRQISHLDLAAMNPFISFCLYVAARVFVQYLKARSKDAQVRASLQFLLSAMHAIKRKNPLTESFLVQLDVDLGGAGLEDSAQFRAHTTNDQRGATKRSPGCTQEHLGMANMSQRPTYGGGGAAAFSDPMLRQDAHAQALMPDLGRGNISSQFELPNRQRAVVTPGSTSGTTQSPSNGFIDEMDTCPDGSGDQKTPGSSTQSQHNGVAHMYSPQNQQLHPNVGHGDMSMYAQQTSFVLPQDWGANGGGVDVTSATMNGDLSTAGLNELMNGMSEADWSNMLGSMADNNGWETGMDPQAAGLDPMGRHM